MDGIFSWSKILLERIGADYSTKLSQKTHSKLEQLNIKAEKQKAYVEILKFRQHSFNQLFPCFPQKVVQLNDTVMSLWHVQCTMSLVFLLLI